MSNTLGTPERAAAVDGSNSAFGAALRSALSKRRCRRTGHGLSYLSDTVLRQIGLSRADLISAVSEDNPRRHSHEAAPLRQKGGNGHASR